MGKDSQWCKIKELWRLLDSSVNTLNTGQQFKMFKMINFMLHIFYYEQKFKKK